MITSNHLQNLIRSVDTNFEEEYIKILNSLDVYNHLDAFATTSDRYAALKNLYNDVIVYLGQYARSPKRYFLQNLQADCIKELNIIYHHTFKPIQKQVIVSDLSYSYMGIRESYFDFWKFLNPDYTFNIYYDSEAFASNVLIDILKKQTGISSIKETFDEYKEVGDEHLVIFSEKRVRKIHDQRKQLSQFFNEKREADPNISPSEIVKEFLVTRHNVDPNEFETIRNEYVKNYESIGAIDIRRNISSIFDSLDASFYHIYEKELFLRLNLFDANNILKYVLLNTFGGVSLDINYLPKMKEHVFSNISFPQLSAEEIDQLKLIAIMKEKGYVHYGNILPTNLYDNLSAPIKQSIQQELDAVHHPAELFKSIGELSTSELNFLTDFHYSLDNVKSPMIAAHAHSIGTQAILSQIQKRFLIIDSVHNQALLENDSYNQARRAVFKSIQQAPNNDLKKFLLETRYYIDSTFLGISADFLPSAYLTGNPMLLSTARNIMVFWDSLSSVSHTQMGKVDFKNFLLPETKVAYSSELASSGHDFKQQDYKDFLYYAGKEQINIRPLEDFTPGHLIDIDGLTKMCNSTERFPYSKGYLNIILQVQNDANVHKYSLTKFSKNAESSLIIQMTIDQESIYYFSPETKQAVKASIYDGLPGHLGSFEKVKLIIVGHGSSRNNTLGRMLPIELIEYISPMVSKFKQMLPTIKSLQVDLLACKLLNPSSLQDSFSVHFISLINNTNNSLKDFVNGVMENISVTASPYTITMFDSRFSITFDGEVALTRDDLRLRGIIPKYLMSYEQGVLTLKPKQIKNSYEERNELEKAFKSVMEESQLSNTSLDDLSVLFDHEDIALSSALEGQGRAYYSLSDVQEKSLELSDFLQIVEKVDREIYQTRQQYKLSQDYVAVLDSAEEREGKHFITFASKITGDIKEVETQTEEFVKYKELSESKIRPVVEHIIDLSNENFTFERVHIEDTAHVSTLNAAFFVQLLLDFIKSGRDINQLSTAVKVQMYTQMVSTSLGLATDAANVVKIIRQAEEVELQVLPKLVQSIQFLSFVLDGVSLGASIYALIHTQDEFEKKVLESSIGLTSVNFALGLGATTSYIVGASTAAEVLGVLAVPIVGLTIGLGSLVNNILKIEHDAEQVVNFFKMLGEVQRKGYYTLGGDGKVLCPNPVVPVKKIDFGHNRIEFGSIKISKTKGGSIVDNGVYPHYFAAPEPDNRGEGISITDVLFPQSIAQNTLQHPDLILPSALNVRYDTEFNWIFGSGSWSGEGVNTLEKLKNYYGRNFHWRHYATGGERTITKLEPVYEPTEVQVFCDRRDRTFISPIIEDRSAAEKLKYAIYYNDAKYTYIFQHTPIAVSFLPLDWNTEYQTQINLKIDNLVYQTKLENGKIVQSVKLKKIGDIIKIRRFETQYKNVALTHTEKRMEDTDMLKVLEIKIGEQIVHFYGNTKEDIYLSFVSKGFEISLRVDPDKACIDKMFVFGNVKHFNTTKLSELSYLQNYNLPEYLLRDIQIVLKGDIYEQIIRGSVDIIYHEYMIVIDEQVGSKHIYKHIIFDFHLSEDEIEFDLEDAKATVFKKEVKIKKGNATEWVNHYFIQGYTVPRINKTVFGISSHKENQYLMQILGKNRFILKSIYLVDLFMTEMLNILAGIPTIFEAFGFNQEVDPGTEEGRDKILKAVRNLIVQHAIGDAISPQLKDTSKLNLIFDDNLMISGIDVGNRNLKIIFDKTSYSLSSGYWLSEETGIDFNYNLLGNRELALTKQPYAKDQHMIRLNNTDSLFLNQYIKSMLIICNNKTELIEFDDLNIKVMGVDNVKEINILLPITSNSNFLRIKLPFFKKDLTWDVEGTNFIIEFSVHGVSKRITILDAFHPNHLDKKIYIFGKDKKELDLISFMGNIV